MVYRRRKNNKKKFLKKKYKKTKWKQQKISVGTINKLIDKKIEDAPEKKYKHFTNWYMSGPFNSQTIYRRPWALGPPNFELLNDLNTLHRDQGCPLPYQTSLLRTDAIPTIHQGTDTNARIGEQIRISSILIKLIYSLPINYWKDPLVQAGYVNRGTVIGHQYVKIGVMVYRARSIMTAVELSNIKSSFTQNESDYANRVTGNQKIKIIYKNVKRYNMTQDLTTTNHVWVPPGTHIQSGVKPSQMPVVQQPEVNIKIKNSNRRVEFKKFIKIGKKLKFTENSAYQPAPSNETYFMLVWAEPELLNRYVPSGLYSATRQQDDTPQTPPNNNTQQLTPNFAPFLLGHSHTIYYTDC